MDIVDAIEELRMFLDCHDGQIIHQCWASGDPRPEKALDGEVETVLDELARLQEATRWRDAAEEMPVPNRRVLVVVTEGEIIIAHWSPYDEWWQDDDGVQFGRAGVTHWRPLPDPPPS